MAQLIVIYGAPFSGKSTVARAFAASLPVKTALVSVDSLVRDAIPVHDSDAFAELEMVHTQVRLLVANYLKNRYNVVLEGAFFYERDAVLHRHEQEIDQLIALMRNLAPSPLLVRLTAAEVTLRERAAALGFDEDVASVLAIDAFYKTRYGANALVLRTDTATPEESAAAIRERLADSGFA